MNPSHQELEAFPTLNLVVVVRHIDKSEYVGRLANIPIPEGAVYVVRRLDEHHD
jgi:hypothetical protein